MKAKKRGIWESTGGSFLRGFSGGGSITSITFGSLTNGYGKEKAKTLILRHLATGYLGRQTTQAEELILDRVVTATLSIMQMEDPSLLVYGSEKLLRKIVLSTLPNEYRYFCEDIVGSILNLSENFSENQQ